MASNILYELNQLTGWANAELQAYSTKSLIGLSDMKEYFLIAGKFPSPSLADDIRKFGATAIAKNNL
jgi:hypothetical protein